MCPTWGCTLPPRLSRRLSQRTLGSGSNRSRPSGARGERRRQGRDPRMEQPFFRRQCRALDRADERRSAARLLHVHHVDGPSVHRGGDRRRSLLRLGLDGLWNWLHRRRHADAGDPARPAGAPGLRARAAALCRRQHLLCGGAQHGRGHSRPGHPGLCRRPAGGRRHLDDPVLFPDQLRSRAIALVSSVWGPISMVGPFVGGILAQYGSWRSAFVLAVPFALVVGILADRVLPPRRADRARAGRSFRQHRPFRWP